MKGGMLKAIALTALAIASPTFGQGDSAPVMPEAPAAPAAEPEPGESPPTQRLKPTYKAKKRLSLPKLEEPSAAIAIAEKAATDIAKRIKATEASTAELVKLAVDFGERKREAIKHAHDSLPGLLGVVDGVYRTLLADDQAEISAAMQDLVLEAARLRESTLAPRTSDADRESAFTAIVESTSADAEQVKAQLQLVRKRFETHGDPWAVTTRIRTFDRSMDAGAKLVLTPDEYFRYLEARGVLKPRDFEIITTPFFQERFGALELPNDLREKASAVLADKDVIPELRLERLYRLLGENHEDALRDALAAARKAQAEALKAAEAERKLKAAEAERKRKAAERARQKKESDAKPKAPPSK